MKRQGFIIPLVLMLISIIVVFATYMYQQGSLFVPLQTTMMRRAQARQLALSGVEIARAQLAVGQEVKKKDQQQKDEQQDRWVPFLKELLPKLNAWQTFDLKKETDGIAGQIRIVIASESGKININEIYDFSKKTFKGEWKKLLPDIFARIQKKQNSSGKMFEAFEKFLKERHSKLNDATELLRLKQFRPFASFVFLSPQVDKKAPRLLYLMDLFTVFGANDKIQPLLFSATVAKVLTNKEPKKLSNEMTQALLKKFKPSINWKQDWKSIGKLQYGVELSQLPKGIEATFDATFDPSIFSVVSYGKVGNVEQKVYAILERTVRDEKKKKVVDVAVKKLYWI